jgi:hypothetical protein
VRSIKEQMKEIKDFPGYFVTEDGRVLSAWKQKRVKGFQGVVTYLDLDDLTEKAQGLCNGYWVTSLYKKGKMYLKKVHRLLAEAYIENPNNYPYINHIDENRQNNTLSNLEWVTPSQNCVHSNCRYEYVIENMITGEKFTIINLREFCRDSGLDHRAMHRTLIGKYSHHKNHRILSKIKFK